MRTAFCAGLVLAFLSCPCSANAAPQQIGGGEGYTCALGASGRAFCWGANIAGQIGNGAGMASSGVEFRPTEMAGGFVTISSGGSHSCGLLADGSAFCWGLNYWGQLGNGSTDNNGVSLPVRVQSSVSFTSISAGGSHTCALDQTGQAWCWGLNSESQLGNNAQSFFLSTTPVRVLSNAPGAVQSFVSITAGNLHTCAIDAQGIAWCWGSNRGARAGIDVNICGSSGTIPCSFFRPVQTVASQAPSSLRFRALSAGDVTTCGIDTAGNVQCWGLALRGVPRPQRNPPTADHPAQVGSVTGAVSVSVGSTSVCAVGANQAAFCWGADDKGQLGDGRTPAPGLSSITPAAVAGPQDYVSVSVGLAQACARTATNALRCWGTNASGELGIPLLGGATVSSTPLAVPGVQSSLIAAGGSHACSLDSVGVTACWGKNLNGQIGHGRAATVPPQSVVPTPVARFFLTRLSFGPRPGPSPVPPERLWITMLSGKGVLEAASFSRLAVGAQHACILTTSGLAYCWGSDRLGQVGNGNRITAACRFGPASSQACVPAPTIVSRAAGDVFADISAGAAHSCARGKDGFVRCWGSAFFGEIGSAAVTCGQSPLCPQRAPAQIQVPFGFRPQMVSVASGESSSCATNQADVFCWGVITGTKLPKVMPYQNGPAYVRVGVAAGFACAGVLNGALQCFGGNTSGQLGDGTNTSSATPTLVSPNAFSNFANSQGFFSCGVDVGTPGAVFCWGENSSGQLGNGATVASNVPAQVTLDAGFVAANVGVGFNHACAISAAGVMRCWGNNASGQLGNGQVGTSAQSNPVVVAGGWRLP